jgi:hypothetical protein
MRSSSAERAGDADARIVGAGLVVEVLEFGLGGDRGVDLPLPGDARLPPFGMQSGRLLGPGIARRIGQSVGRVAPIRRVIDRVDHFADFVRIVIALGNGPKPSHVVRPRIAGLARDFPFLPILAERDVELGAQRLQRFLPLLARSRRSRHCLRSTSR